MKTTRVHPDTCECVFEYIWDEIITEADRVHVFDKVNNTCPNHTGLSGITLYDTVLKENSTKNILKQEIIDSIPRLTKKITISDGSEVDDLDVDYNWSFSGSDANRQLDVIMTELTDTEKTNLQSFMDALSDSTTVVIQNV